MTKRIILENWSAYNQLYQEVEKILSDIVPFKLTFSKARKGASNLISLHAQPVLIKGEKQVKCTFREKTRDETKIETEAAFLEKLPVYLKEYFFNLDVFLSRETLMFKQNKKGNAVFLRKNISHELPDDLAHDHQKKSYVYPEASYYKSLGLVSGHGNVFSKGQKKYNQVNKYLETLDHLLQEETPEGSFTIADMGSGKAYLTFALYDFLTRIKHWNVSVTGYEARPDLVDLCNQVARANGMEKLTFKLASIDQLPVKNVDMVIALHACDIATDMAIAHGINSNAKYMVLAPCCQKQIRQSMSGENALSSILKFGILKERQAEILTDGMRALLLQYKGYQTKVLEFISMEHTKKNVMITAIKSKPNSRALIEFKQIKESYGISYHYLEKMLGL